ncbi:tRNA epoxyqueuosine(34) reductase QueG [Natranaerobius thermophilus]|uniref:4Fe-4S ferredoxin-type domain-containing protein n=1 Tax=Natranaerobius thermophilus (strain ATCC BAA-1301 / DSM 18059 / JW/NM-WN-LF) TaxID=457570 RepID=B2A678_NATTJ|nr:tRNA epoxyqueuosine(34) reductase QueG [Natranaerobius thermophilus]ACB84089.1 protein of unknown function DUF1730 [Natranaerobius thermophilus JW/NM-WN-LF]
MNSLSKLRQMALNNGFVSTGVISPDEYKEGKSRQEQAQARGHLMPFINKSQNLATRVNPSKYANWVKTVILVLYPYGGSNGNHPPKPDDGVLRGRFSKISWGRDYHLVVKKALQDLASDLVNEDIISETYETFIDTSPFAERELAFRAGLGYPGRHGCLINPTYGSFVVIGGILTDTMLPTNEQPVDEIFSTCKSCDECITVCPGKALEDSNHESKIQLENCAAYLTVVKGIIPRKKRPIIKDYLYGCDECQNVCPENSSNNFGSTNNDCVKTFSLPKWDEQHLTIEDLYPQITKILNLSNQTFRKKYKDNAVFWRGKQVLKRNAVIALGNLKDPKGLPLILETLANPSPIIRAHVPWSLEQISTQLPIHKKSWIYHKLEQQYLKESDPLVIDELKSSLLNLSK